jgi:hypothetical protein
MRRLSSPSLRRPACRCEFRSFESWSDALSFGKLQHSENDDVLATGLVDVRPQMVEVEAQMNAATAEDRGMLVATHKSCAIAVGAVGAKTSKAGLPIRVTLAISLVA